MKKIILVLTLLLLCSCYDYKELTSINIITGIGIDYIDNEYVVSLEVLKPLPKEQQTEDKTEIITNSNKVFSKAFEGTYSKLSNYPNFSQLQTLLISEDVAKENLQEVFDFILRTSRIGNTFYTTIIKDNTSLNILNTKQKNNTVSNTIIGLLENSNDFSFITNDNQFDSIISRLLSTGEDIYLPSIELVDNTLKVSDIALFKDFKLVNYLNNNSSTILSLCLLKLNNNIYYNNDLNSIDINKNNLKIETKENKFKLILNIDSTIKSIDKKYSLRDKETFTVLESQFEEKIKQELDSSIKELQKNNTDILGIGNIYYKHNPNKYNDNYFKDNIFETEVNVNINKFGILFEVIK